ncbi:MAG TPA: hypothetical protein DD415_05065 [Clostridiales bacterium]|nr:hypothetical protein [Clostridiales bacterium]
MGIGGFIGIAITSVLVIAVILKILSKYFVANLICMALAAIGVIVYSFAMPEVQDGKIDWNWVLPQFIFLFLFFVICCAGFAFEEEEYINTEGSGKWSGDTFSYKEESKLESRSMFWSCLGGSFAAAAILIAINYTAFETNAIALGVIGCIALCFPAYFLISLLLARKKHRNYYG